MLLGNSALCRFQYPIDKTRKKGQLFWFLYFNWKFGPQENLSTTLPYWTTKIIPTSTSSFSYIRNEIFWIFEYICEVIMIATSNKTRFHRGSKSEDLETTEYQLKLKYLSLRVAESTFVVILVAT